MLGYINPHSAVGGVFQFIINLLVGAHHVMHTSWLLRGHHMSICSRVLVSDLSAPTPDVGDGLRLLLASTAAVTHTLHHHHT